MRKRTESSGQYDHLKIGAKEHTMRIRDEIMSAEGVFCPVTRAVQLVQAILDSGLLAAQQRVIRHFPDQVIRNTEDEAYSIRVVLVNTRTDSHMDASD